MHVLGHILTWTVFLAGTAGTVLMARSLDVKSSYTKKIASLKDSNAKAAEANEAKQRELDRLNAEYERLIYGWGNQWDASRNAQGQNVPATGRWSATGAEFQRQWSRFCQRCG